MESNASATLSLIEDLLQTATHELPVDPCFEKQALEDELAAVEFDLPMAEAILV